MALILNGLLDSFCVPEVLYHGTWSARAEDILNLGLQHELGQSQSIASIGANYLTTSLGLAASIARSRAARHGSAPSVLEVDASALDPDALMFDINLCGMHWTESVAYHKTIPPEVIRRASVNAKDVPNELMLLDDPMPGERPLVFKLAWSRADEFLAATGLGPTVIRAPNKSRPR